MNEKAKTEPEKYTGDHQKMLVEDGLYTEYDLTDISADTLREFIWSGTADLYCPECESQSVFAIQDEPYKPDPQPRKVVPKEGMIIVEARCPRNVEKHGHGVRFRCGCALYVCFYRNENRMVKIGAYPSRAETDLSGMNPAIRELEPALRKEWGRAIGLRAHGVGVGSFVYLRRIFEQLLEQAHVKATTEPKWKEKKYKDARVPERIKMLKEYLPVRLVKSAALYSILSKGLHELSEDECKKHFDLVKQAIEYILVEEHSKKKFDVITKGLNEVVGQKGNAPGA